MCVRGACVVRCGAADMLDDLTLGAHRHGLPPFIEKVGDGWGCCGDVCQRFASICRFARFSSDT